MSPFFAPAGEVSKQQRGARTLIRTQAETAIQIRRAWDGEISSGFHVFLSVY
jgi:hypothetical protein